MIESISSVVYVLGVESSPESRVLKSCKYVGGGEMGTFVTHYGFSEVTALAMSRCLSLYVQRVQFPRRRLLCIHSHCA